MDRVLPMQDDRHFFGRYLDFDRLGTRLPSLRQNIMGGMTHRRGNHSSEITSSKASGV